MTRPSHRLTARLGIRSTVEAKLKEDRVRAHRTKAEVKVEVTADGIVVDDGKVVR